MRPTLVLCLSVALAGCAGGQRADVGELQRQLDSVRREAQGAKKQIGELENRVFLLEDKLDTVQVAQGRNDAVKPRLPVVTKKRTKTADPAAAVEEDEPAQGADDDVVIVYEGDAAKDDDGPVPSYRGDDRPRYDDDGYPEPASVKKTLGVEAVPDTPKTKAKTKAAAETPDDDGDDPKAVYGAALAALKAKDHAKAIEGFERFLAAWPDHDYADNAAYWLGETYYDEKDYATAVVRFRDVVEQYPSGNKAPDALLKLGYCLALTGDADAAKDVLAQVIEIYPQTDAAQLAAKRLEKLRD